MPVVTSLGFSIFSRYKGGGIGRAKRDLNDLTDNFRRVDRSALAASRKIRSSARSIAKSFRTHVVKASSYMARKVRAGWGRVVRGGQWATRQVRKAGRSMTRIFQKIIPASVRSLARSVGRGFRAAARAMRHPIRSMSRAVRAVARVFTRVLPRAARTAARGIRAGWNAAGRAVRSIGRGMSIAARSVGRVFTRVLPRSSHFMVRGVRAGWRAAGRVVRSVGRGMSAAARSVARVFIRTLPRAARALGRGVRAGWRSAGRAVRTLGRGMRAATRAVGRVFTRTLPRAARAMANGVRAGWRSAGRAVRTIGRRIRASTRGVARAFRSIPGAAGRFGASVKHLWRRVRSGNQPLVRSARHTRRLRRAFDDARASGSKLGGALRGALIPAFAAMAPAIAPVTGALLALGGAFAASSAAAGAALGVYTIALGGAIKRMRLFTKDEQAHNATEQRFIILVHKARHAWYQFLTATEKFTLQPATLMLRGFIHNLHKLIPLVKATHPVIMGMAKAFNHWLGRRNGLNRFVNTVIKYGVPSLNAMARAGRNMLAVLGYAFRALAPLGLSLSKVMLRGARAMREWAAGGGFQRFVAMVRKNGPELRAFFHALWGAIRNASVAMAGMGPSALKLATALLRVVAALPPGVLQALVYGWFAWRTAMIAVAGAEMIGNLYKLAKAIRGLAIANSALAASQGGGRLGMFGQLKMLVGKGGLIGAVIVALILLGIGIYFLAKKCKWFRDFWKMVWKGILVYFKWYWRQQMAMFRAIGWYFTKFLPMYFRFLWRVAKWTWKGILWSAKWSYRGMKFIFHGMVWFFTKLLPKAARLMGRGVRAGWRLLVRAGRWAWRGIKVVARGIRWLFIRGIPAAARFMGRAARAGWRLLVRVGRWAWRGIKIVARGIRWLFIRGIPAAARFMGRAARAGWRLLVRVGRWAWRGIKIIARGIRWLFVKGIPAAARFMGRAAKAGWRLLVRVGKWAWRGIKVIARGIRWLFIKGIPKAARFMGRAARGGWRLLVRVGRWAWRGIKIVARGIRWLFVKGIPRAARFMGRAVRGGWRLFLRFGRWALRGIRGVVRVIGRFFTRTVPRAARFLGRGVKAGWSLARRGAVIAARGIRGVVRAVFRFFTRVVPRAARFLGRGVKAGWSLARRGAVIAARGIRGVVRAIFRFFTRTVPKAARFLGRAVRNGWALARRGAVIAARGIRGVVRAVVFFFAKVLPRAARFMWRWVVRRWRGLGKGVLAVYRFMRNRVFGGLKWFFTRLIPSWAKQMGKAVIRAFRFMRSGVAAAWRGLKRVTKGPINFVIKWVYNKGIRGLWNLIAGKFHLKKLPKARMLAHGGHVDSRKRAVRGQGTRKSDSIPALLSRGEHVWTAREVQAAGGHRGVERLRKSVLRGKPNGTPQGSPRAKPWGGRKAYKWGFSEGVPPRRYADGGGGDGDDGGGFLDSIGDFFGKVGGGIKDVVGKVADIGGSFISGAFKLPGKVLKKLADLARGAMYPVFALAAKPIKAMIKGSLPEKPEFTKGMRNMALEAVDGFLAWVKADDDAHGCGGGGLVPWKKWESGDGQHVGYRGVTINRRTRAMLLHAEKLVHRTFHAYQGSYSNAAASAGTHTGGGAIDVGPPIDAIVGAMRASGFAAWKRGRNEGFSPHIHGIAAGDPTASSAAKAQVRALAAGRNGLADNGPDTFTGGGKSACSGGGRTGPGVKGWKKVAAKAIQMAHLPRSMLGCILSIMQQESGGNPRAVNRTDSNARAGMASRGLMQVIPPTFRAFHVSGTSNDIFDPLANIAAAANYIRIRYNGRCPGSPYAMGGPVMGLCKGGCPSLAKKGKKKGGLAVGGAPVFDNGGTLPPGLSMVYNATGKDEHLVPAHPAAGGGTVHNHFDFSNSVITSRRQAEEMVLRALGRAEDKGRARAGVRRGRK